MNCVIYTVNTRSVSPQQATSKCNQSKQNISGVLYVKKTPEKSSEEVKIVVSLRRLDKIKPTCSWKNLLQRKQPTTVEEREFSVNKQVWLSGDGINWVIPTHLFGETNIQIDLNSSALLTTGFIIEVYRRDCVIVQEEQPNARLGAGCTINFNITWNLSTNPVRATPFVTPSIWPPAQSETERDSVNLSQLSVNSDSSFFRHQFGLSSDDEN